MAGHGSDQDVVFTAIEPIKGADSNHLAEMNNDKLVAINNHRAVMKDKYNAPITNSRASQN